MPVISSLLEDCVALPDANAVFVQYRLMHFERRCLSCHYMSNSIIRSVLALIGRATPPPPQAREEWVEGWAMFIFLWGMMLIVNCQASFNWNMEACVLCVHLYCGGLVLMVSGGKSIGAGDGSIWSRAGWAEVWWAGGRTCCGLHVLFRTRTVYGAQKSLFMCDAHLFIFERVTCALCSEGHSS